MKHRLAWVVSIGVVLLHLGSERVVGWADVVVIANRSRQPADISVQPQLGRLKQYRIPQGDLVSVPTSGGLTVAVRGTSRRRPTRYELDANCAYYLGETRAGAVILTRIGLGGDVQTTPKRGVLDSGLGVGEGTITVKILVDDDERATRRVWEQRLRRRIARASRILEKYCAMRLRVVAVETWTTDNHIHDFSQSLVEFERLVEPAPARLAIGFTSQYQIPHGRTHLGGTKGPLSAHILIREWSQHIPEPQRVELLLHEIGHYLGAVHSPEPQSVMRPVLLRGKSPAASGILRFDPVNTLIMCLVAEEIRLHDVHRFADLTPGTRLRLGQIYRTLIQVSPGDRTAAECVRQLGRPARRRSRARVVNPLIDATGRVVRAIVDAAQGTQRNPGGTAIRGAPPARDSGDALMNVYVRTAARAAGTLRPELAPKAFLLALGIALDDSDRLRKHPQTRDFVRMVESDAERSKRVLSVGQPTMHGHRELARQFVTSAYLTAVIGGARVAAGIPADQPPGSAESPSALPVTLVATEAGILFGNAVLSGKITLQNLADHFTVTDYIMEPVEVRGGWRDRDPDGAAEPASRQHQPLPAVLQEIRRHLRTLPGYR